MRLWLADMGAVIRRGWWLIGLIWGVGLLGAGGQVLQALYSHHQWHWPSPWWVLFVFAGVIVAQQLVIKDRRVSDAQPGSLGQSALDAVQAGLPQGTRLMLREEGVEIHATRDVTASALTAPAPPPEQLELPAESATEPDQGS